MAKVNWGKVGFWGGLFGLFAYLASNDDKETVPAPATGLGGTDTEDGIEFSGNLKGPTRTSKFNDIVRDGISYNKKQIKKLETEIEKFQKGKKGATQAQKDKIDEIIKWDRKLISDFRAEISSLKKRL